MRQPLKITVGNLAKFNNALHAQFHNEMHDIVRNNIPVGIINLTAADLDEWKRLVKLEIDINRQASMSEVTKRLSETDKQRDDILTYIFDTVRAALRSPIAPQREMAERVNVLVRTYAGIQSKGLDEETVLILGLCTDLRKPAMMSDVQSLGLWEAVQMLESANEDFRSLRAERATEQISASLPTAKETRPKTDAIYETICQYIIASHLLSKSQEDVEAIEALVTRMNKQIGDLKTVSKQSGKVKVKNE